MQLKPIVSVCRTSKSITVEVNNQEAAHNISFVIADVSTDAKNEKTVFKEPINQKLSHTTVQIPNLVPEYTYNVTVAYSTMYGSLTPSKVVTKLGVFDKMEREVGCRVKVNTMNLNIKPLEYNTTASICAALCHSMLTCSFGWTFQLSTGSCYSNLDDSNLQEREGWAVGTQSCNHQSAEEEDCDQRLTEDYIEDNSSTDNNEPCCPVQEVEGFGDLDGTYYLQGHADILEDVCVDDCVYSKNKNPDELFCFRKDETASGSVSCSAK